MTGLLLSARHSFRAELHHAQTPVGARAVRRALAHLDASEQAATLTVPELASVVGVSVRALQAGFRTSLDATPLEILHERRMRLAHRDLQNAAPATTTVAAVADRWGFAHHGRFAAEYRRRFGEAPSDTLRR